MKKSAFFRFTNRIDFYVSVIKVLTNILFYTEYRIPRRWTVVNLLTAISLVVGISLSATLHINISSKSNSLFCYWGYMVFPALTLGSKAAQTCIAIVRYIYIHCDMICRICNDLTIEKI